MLKKPYFLNKKLLRQTSNLPINIRKTILIIFDIISLSTIIIFSNILLNKFSSLYFLQIKKDIFYFTIVAIPIYLFCGQYKEITEFISKRNLYFNLFRNLIVSTIVLFLTRNNLLYLFTIAISQTFSTYLLRNFIAQLISFSKVSKTKKIVIYGAGEAGAKFANSLILNKDNEILFFIDDKSSLWSRSILGIPIKSRNALNKHKKEIDILFLAIPTLSSEDKFKLLNKLYEYPFDIMTIPSLEELLSGKSKISEFRSIKLEDLIYRDIAEIDRLNIRNNFHNKTILITGAAGSIGSAITKEIIKVFPKRIIMLDFSEYNLYNLKNNLINKVNSEIDLIFFLGNCCNQNLVHEIFNNYKIDVIIHSAAYKHVPMVENNPLSGLSNNILSTRIISEIAIKNNVEKAILISTDKAVRPTNIMGASKRVAELIFLHSQNIVFSNKDIYKTKFSIVRFGNVLGSSGSVVPLFKKQIANGGPITITDPEITRYFMTIEEATILVLEAASFSKGGELFLLDMGKPIKVIDLAKKLIKLNGLKVKDRNNKDGDIKFKFIGLREGEKLYEELLIDGNAIRTQNKYIYLARESRVSISKNKLNLLNDLINNLESRDKLNSINLLKKLVPEWKKNL